MIPPVPSQDPAIPANPAGPGLLRGWWPNPIFRRYTRSRLRPHALSAALLIVGLVAAFLFFMPRTAAFYRGHLSVADAERTPIFFLLTLQAIILFILGTGNVAAGATAEADEGTLDYQRLNPLSPLRKVIGYLLGLPIREWCMFALTLPFTGWCLWKGEVPASAWVPVYTVLISSALLYHLTGLVTASVVKNRRWAFLSSILIIILLYTVIPQAAKFGLVFFKYLTIWPVIDDKVVDMMPSEAGGLMRMARRITAEPDVSFFGLRFSATAFTLLSQGMLILTFVVMLWRKWRRAESHPLGKLWAAGLFAWIQFVLLGNALPLIAPGLLFPTRQFFRRYVQGEVWEPQMWEALAMIGIYGLATMLMMIVLTLIITPAADSQLRGLRRARKLGWPRVPRFSDASSSFLYVVFMAVTGAAGWGVFARRLIASDWFNGHHLSSLAGPAFAVLLLGVGLISQAVLEGWGGRRFFLLVVFAGLVPVMAGGIVGTISSRALTPAVWLAGISPISSPVYAAKALVPTETWGAGFDFAAPRAFWFWQGLTVLLAVWLVIRLREIHRSRREKVMVPVAVELPPPAKSGA